MSDHDFTLAKQLIEEVNKKSAGLRIDMSAEEYSSILKFNEQAAEKITRLRAELDQAQKLVVMNGAEADRLEAEVQRRGEMLRQCMPHLAAAMSRCEDNSPRWRHAKNLRDTIKSLED